MTAAMLMSRPRSAVMVSVIDVAARKVVERTVNLGSICARSGWI